MYKDFTEIQDLPLSEAIQRANPERILDDVHQIVADPESPESALAIRRWIGGLERKLACDIGKYADITVGFAPMVKDHQTTLAHIVTPKGGLWIMLSDRFKIPVSSRKRQRKAK